MRKRRAVVVFLLSTVFLIASGASLSTAVQNAWQQHNKIEARVQHQPSSVRTTYPAAGTYGEALETLETLEVKGRASKTGYERSQFGNGWQVQNGCSTRDIILFRDLYNKKMDGECKVVSGTLDDPYTGAVIAFTKEKSAAVQIEHVVALSDAWQKGAQRLSREMRIQLANDPLELIAVDGPANMQKGDGDAATWLPKNKAFRCEYIARQVAVKKKYTLWVTPAEKIMMEKILKGCIP